MKIVYVYNIKRIMSQWKDQFNMARFSKVVIKGSACIS